MFPNNVLPDHLEVFLTQPGDGKRIIAVGREERIFSQGDSANAVFFIQSGQIKITVVSEQGKEAIVAILGRGHFLGERALSDFPIHVTSAIALDDALLTAIERHTMLGAMAAAPELCKAFVDHLLHLNLQLEEDVAAHLFDSSEKRLARVLLRLAQFDREDPKHQLLEKFTQEALAEMIGTTRSRVNQFLNKFRRLGYVDYEDKLIIHSTLLNVLVEEPTPPKPMDDRPADID